MLHPKIAEISTDKATGCPFFLVHFWKSKGARARRDKPFLINSHVMVLNPSGDLKAQIAANIRRYAKAAEECGYAGDHSSANAVTTDAFSEGGKVVRRNGARVAKPTERDQSDPHGILANPEVAALRDKDLDLEVA